MTSGRKLIVYQLPALRPAGVSGPWRRWAVWVLAADASLPSA
jgi:hypothetical protein